MLDAPVFVPRKESLTAIVSCVFNSISISVCISSLNFRLPVWRTMQCRVNTSPEMNDYVSAQLWYQEATETEHRLTTPNTLIKDNHYHWEKFDLKVNPSSINLTIKARIKLLSISICQTRLLITPYTSNCCLSTHVYVVPGRSPMWGCFVGHLVSAFPFFKKGNTIDKNRTINPIHQPQNVWLGLTLGGWHAG